jgi:hypothetical protein
LKAKTQLVLWILVVPLIMYLGVGVVVVWPFLLYEAEIRGWTVSPITVLPQAWALVWAAFLMPGGVVMIVILAAVWLYGFFQLNKRYAKEKAD